MKVLHITSWYPSQENPVEGIFIREHIFSLPKDLVSNTIIHLKISKGSFGIFSEKEKGFEKKTIRLPVDSWFIKEIFVSIVLFFILLRRAKEHDIINFHIAYPMLTYWHIIKLFFNRKVVCNEHWSAYGNNFGLKSEKKTKRIRRIFFQNILFITVSHHLANQLKNFSKNKEMEFHVLPNVASKSFNLLLKKPTGKVNFLSAAIWRTGKRPVEMIKGFAELLKEHENVHMIIAGNGELLPEMRLMVKELQIEHHVHFKGLLSKKDLAAHLSPAAALCLSSDYETFSVICAEALCTGTPVIVTKLPAVQEFVDEFNGIFIKENTVEDWCNGFKEFLKKKESYNLNEIANKAKGLFYPDAVGQQYYTILKSYYEKNG